MPCTYGGHPAIIEHEVYRVFYRFQGGQFFNCHLFYTVYRSRLLQNYKRNLNAIRIFLVISNKF